MMKVDYTLPGSLPDTPLAPATPSGERPAEAFRSQLQQLRVPEITDWRALLRLNIPATGGARMGPPPAPNGVDSRDGESQRAWWRAMLQKHTQAHTGPGAEEDGQAPVRLMLDLLSESQRREDEIFARHFAEGGD
jgi:hypothetical protein